MTTLLVAIALTFIAIGGAWFIAPRPDNYVLTRIVIGWIGVTLIVFLVFNNLYAFILIAIFLGLVAPINPVRRVYFYIGIMAAAPLAFTAFIPFPGINYLLIIDYAKVTTFAVLLPVFLIKVSEKTPPVLRMVDRFLLIFVLFTTVILFRELPITSVFRVLVYQLLLIYVPYIAISRTLKTKEDFDGALKALFVALTIIALIGLLSLLRSWNYYSLMYDYAGFKVFAEYRNGLLRIYTTMSTTLLAFAMGAGVILTLYMKRIQAISAPYAYGIAVVFALIAYASGSRGGHISVLVIFASYFVLTKLGNLWRRIFIYTLLAVGIGGTYRVMTDTSFISGEMNNIVYRAEIMRASVGQIADHLFFGEFNFIESPRFAHLVQGEGIVDIVNTYLEVVLAFGLVGFTLWFGSFISAIRTLFSQSVKMRTWQQTGILDDSEERKSALLLAILFGFLVMIFTTSAVSHVYHFGYLALALMVAHGRVVAITVDDTTQSKNTSGAVISPEPEPSPEGQDKQIEVRDTPVGYGARFVRRN